jgi:hypothetical protein
MPSNAPELGRLEDGDTVAGHVPVADEERGRGQGGDALIERI